MLEDIQYLPGMDVVTPIWTDIYIIRTQSINVTPKHTYRRRGTPMTGVKSLDNSYVETESTVGITVNGMVEIFRNGGTIWIDNDKDVFAIYKALQLHIQYWIHVTNYQPSMNKINVPIDDLILMDEFSKAIYPSVESSSITELRTLLNKPTDSLHLFDMANPVPATKPNYQTEQGYIPDPADINNIVYRDTTDVDEFGDRGNVDVNSLRGVLGYFGQDE